VRKTLFIAIAVALGLSLSAFRTVDQAQEANAEAIAGAMAALDEFMLTFNSKDMEAWAATLNYPHVRFAGGGGVTVWESAEEFAMGTAFENLARIGWDHSHWLSREVTMASPNKVHIATVFQRFNDQNEPIARYQSLYLVTLVDGHWGTQARSSLAP
jgi:hypothetical protein